MIVFFSIPLMEGMKGWFDAHVQLCWMFVGIGQFVVGATAIDIN
jgi:hypothetical protein